MVMVVVCLRAALLWRGVHHVGVIGKVLISLVHQKHGRGAGGAAGRHVVDAVPDHDQMASITDLVISRGEPPAPLHPQQRSSEPVVRAIVRFAFGLMK